MTILICAEFVIREMARDATSKYIYLRSQYCTSKLHEKVWKKNSNSRQYTTTLRRINYIYTCIYIRYGLKKDFRITQF